MPTTVISVASFQNLCAECADAIASGSWATAWSKYAQAEAVNAGLELSISDGGSSLQRRQSLANLQTALQAASAAAQMYANEPRIALPRFGTRGA